MAEEKVDPIENLHLIQETLKRVRRHFFFGSGPVYKVWGLVWIVGFVLTNLIVRGPLQNVVPGVAMGGLWIVLTTVAGMYTFSYFKRQPINTAARSRFALVWVVALTLMATTVAGLGSLGLSVDGVQFAVFALFTVAIIYMITGAILFDNVQMIVGIWLAIANVIGMQLGPDAYLNAMAVLGGGGFIVAGFIDDRIHRPSGEGQ